MIKIFNYFSELCLKTIRTALSKRWSLSCNLPRRHRGK